MKKTALTILGALLIAGSAVQMATASEHHMRKAQRAPISATEQLRRANNSIDGYNNSFRNDSVDFERRNAFN